ncbi:hypothetical protein [Domibacillus enclensis]|uniref:Uncharacterized protein n=1 Tax=Domibacillus enclensis TaxID=1017273 RepID=A0A1N7C4L2_9BACI|nr:hypothetical protein [Domibacillus enclensis]OXS74237.1 hypothetical protein B1B05_17345 [Domibacillus enclensis]SIR58510.1 hypothetical protein SAMN05443094_11166 [Domibacillus enclensis]
MGKDLELMMQGQMNRYQQLMEKQVATLAKAKEDTEAALADLEQETVNLMKDRKMNAAERLNKLGPLMEEQDRFNSFLESVESLLGRHLRKQGE